MSNSWAGREDKVELIKALLPITHKPLALGPVGEEGGLGLLPPGPPAPTQHPQGPTQPPDHQGCRTTLLRGHRDVGTREDTELPGPCDFGALPDLSLGLPSTAPAWQESPGAQGGTLWMKSPVGHLMDPALEDPGWVLLT